MAEMTLQAAAQVSGVPYALLKKHAQRGQLRTTKGEGNRIMVSEADLEAYVGAKQIEGAIERSAGQPATVFSREIASAMGGLPSNLQQAILDGIPTTKRPGNAEAWRKALKDMDKDPKFMPKPVIPDQGGVGDDPHFGFPIGHAHKMAPQWKRVSLTAWSLNDCTWSWNGTFWEGGGLCEERTLDPKFSPANPEVDFRPIAPSKPAPTGKAQR